MIRALVERNFDQTKKYVELAGLSTDSKPASGVITGSKFYEVDTGVSYAFDEIGGTWEPCGLTPDEIKAEIDAWLDDHPEATTTVEDGAISYAKLNSSLQETVDEVPALKSAITLEEENIPGTTQTISFDSSGNVSSIVHKDGGNNTIRSDAFTFGTSTITEVRTLYTGETLTIVTNTDTLVTTVTYAAA